MQVDALAVRLRPRGPMEASDLGVRLCQSAARNVYVCYGVVAVPVMGLALASFEIAEWLPGLLIWLAKPWLDRTILFVLSRSAFGQTTTVADLWKAQRQVWWRRLLFTLTVRRLSPWRSFTEPVYLLEGSSIRQAGTRVRQIRRGMLGSAFMMTGVFNATEIALEIALLSLVIWFTPAGLAFDVLEFIADESSGLMLFILHATYAATVLFLEPFYVAAGFAMYLNRRAELEAWDIEQEFRRAFGH